MLFSICIVKLATVSDVISNILKNSDETAYLISLRSQKFTSSKKKYFIVGNLKLQKQGNKTSIRS